MTKQSKLDRIEKDILKCLLCKKDKIGLPVPGEGSANAKVMFIGEAPGKEESKTGRPFVHRAGKILRQLITDIGLKEKDVFITSPVHYLPKHGTPTKEEVEHGRIHTFKQLEVIKPKIAVLLGRVACLAMLDLPCQIAKEHGKIVEKDGQKYLITYHPAAPLYSRKVLTELKKDFKKISPLLKQNGSQQ